MNCIQERLILLKYFEKTKEKITSATKSKLKISYNLSSVYICNNKYCFKNVFILVKNLKQQGILGTPFLLKCLRLLSIWKGFIQIFLEKKLD